MVLDMARFWQHSCRESPPPSGACVLSCTNGMASREQQLCGHVLVATVLGSRPAVSPTDMVDALCTQCCIRQSEVLVEVCAPPADFFVQFKSKDDCERVLNSWSTFLCGDASISFLRWHDVYGGVPSELRHLCTLSFDSLPFHVRDPEMLNRLVNSIGGKMVELYLPLDSWSIDVRGFMKNPCSVPKVFDVELTVPADYKNPRYPQPPCSPNGTRLWSHRIIIHLVDVVDHDPIIHEFKTWAVHVDGTSPRHLRNDGHTFGGRAGRARF
ncbi:unnamed protein product [Alopecurus aequalis]